MNVFNFACFTHVQSIQEGMRKMRNTFSWRATETSESRKQWSPLGWIVSERFQIRISSLHSVARSPAILDSPSASTATSQHSDRTSRWSAPSSASCPRCRHRILHLLRYIIIPSTSWRSSASATCCHVSLAPSWRRASSTAREAVTEAVRSWPQWCWVHCVLHS